MTPPRLPRACNALDPAELARLVHWFEGVADDWAAAAHRREVDLRVWPKPDRVGRGYLVRQLATCQAHERDARRQARRLDEQRHALLVAGRP